MKKEAAIQMLNKALLALEETNIDFKLGTLYGGNGHPSFIALPEEIGYDDGRFYVRGNQTNPDSNAHPGVLLEVGGKGKE